MPAHPQSDLVEIGSAGEAPFNLDIGRFVGGHMVIQANSGAGKSWLIRKLLEATYGHLQHIVLDPEDDFYTLRQGFDYLLAGGDDGDCPANLHNAYELARTILKTGVNAIVRISDLDLDDRREFVALFIGALMTAPREFWHPAMIVLDEANRFVPQDGREASSEAVISLAAQGRKRGFTAVLATQRYSKIDKDATGDVNNWLIGRVGQATDRRIAADALGFPATSPDAKSLLTLQPGSFYAFGPALSPSPVLVHVGGVRTQHLKAGQAKVPTPPAPEAMKGLLEALTAASRPPAPDAPATAGTPTSATPSADVDAIRAEGYAEGLRRGIDEGERREWVRAHKAAVAHFDEGMKALLASFGAERADPPRLDPAPPAPPPEPAVCENAQTRDRAASPTVQKIVNEIIRAFPLPISFAAAAARAGVSKRSSAYRSYAAGVADHPDVRAHGDKLIATRHIALPPGEDPVEIFAKRLPPNAARILRALRDSPWPRDKGEIADITGISPTSSGLGSGLNSLIEVELARRLPGGKFELADSLRR